MATRSLIWCVGVRADPLVDGIDLKTDHGRLAVDEFMAARETTQLLRDDPDSVSPGDVGDAVNGYRLLYEYLIEERAAP